MTNLRPVILPCPLSKGETVIHHKTKHSTGRKSVAALLLLVLILILASCGGTDSGGGEPGGASGQGETTQAAVSDAGQYILPGAIVYPEGVAYQPETGNFFVGSTTDGTVFRGSVENGGETEVFLEPGSDGRETAVGMKVDEIGRLYIAGGDTGRIFVYDAPSGDLIRSFETPSTDMTFLNDAAVAPNGSAYFIDSMRLVLFRVPASDGAVGGVESWLDLEGTAIEYGEGSTSTASPRRKTAIT